MQEVFKLPWNIVDSSDSSDSSSDDDEPSQLKQTQQLLNENAAIDTSIPANLPIPSASSGTSSQYNNKMKTAMIHVYKHI